MFIDGQDSAYSQGFILTYDDLKRDPEVFL